MKVARFLDIDLSSSNGGLDHFSGIGIERAKMLSAFVEDFYLAMERIPSVEPLAAMTSPSSRARYQSEKLETVQYRRFRNRFRHRRFV
jgi:hypothetical protein